MLRDNQDAQHLYRICVEIFLFCVFLIFISGCRERYFKAVPNKDFKSSFYNGDSELKEFEIHYIVHRPSERIRKTLRLYERKDLEVIEHMLLRARPLIDMLHPNSFQYFFDIDGYHVGSISTIQGGLYKIFVFKMVEGVWYLGLASKKSAYYFKDEALRDKLKDFVKTFEGCEHKISLDRYYSLDKKGFVRYQENVREE